MRQCSCTLIKRQHPQGKETNFVMCKKHEIKLDAHGQNDEIDSVQKNFRVRKHRGTVHKRNSAHVLNNVHVSAWSAKAHASWSWAVNQPEQPHNFFLKCDKKSLSAVAQRVIKMSAWAPMKCSPCCLRLVRSPCCLRLVRSPCCLRLVRSPCCLRLVCWLTLLPETSPLAHLVAWDYSLLAHLVAWD